MHAQEISLEVPSQGARRATEEESTNGWQKPERFSVRQKDRGRVTSATGRSAHLLSRELRIPAARLVTWREAGLAAGQEALKKQPLDSRDREIGHLREKLGEATMAMELLREKIRRLETTRPLRARRARR